ncbi:MAG: mannonate dehydratase [Saprospiraceae bacterium]|nr:mannonate dehydratase [Saprospiraceae bacterium]
MKLGLGLYKSLLNDQNFQFASQAGATDIVVQLVDYVKGENNPSLTQNYLSGWGVTRNHDKIWSYDELVALRKQIESHGLRLAAIENFDPSHWYDVLLDGPKRSVQMENLKTIIRNLGKAEIPVMGYYFSLAGVWGWSSGKSGRGKANSVIFDAESIDLQQPIPQGMVWNMIYDESISSEIIPPVSRETMWFRLQYFLDELLPVAEEAGVKLVAHPDDPPLPYLRNTGRLFYTPAEYEKLLEINDSPNSGFEFCMGTIQEMQEGDIYALLDKYSARQKIGYIHFRNVVGKVPNYREAFVDEGDIDMIKALRILRKNQYSGVLIPDHTPEMSTAAPWHTGMAFALGYMRGAMQALERE